MVLLGVKMEGVSRIGISPPSTKLHQPSQTLLPMAPSFDYTTPGKHCSYHHTLGNSMVY